MKPSEEKYRRLLNGHDWSYNFSDDYSVWAKGKERMNSIFALQPDVDPDFAIYNTYAPDDYKRVEK